MEKGGGSAVTRALSQGSLSLEAAGELKQQNKKFNLNRVVTVNGVNTRVRTRLL